MDDNLKHCWSMLVENDVVIRDSALRIMFEMCENIVNYPDNAKYRKLRIANSTISTKLLPVSGAIECLFELGFIEDGEYFTLPSNVSLSRVHKFRKMIDDFRNNRPTIKTTVATRPKDPSPTNFFQTITNCFQDVLKYENKELLKTAKSAVPIVRLQLEAMKKMRALQKEIKVKSTVAVNGPNIDGQNELSIEDILLAEIVHWFKNDFFTWVDSPSCNLCTGQCSFHRNEYRPDPTISRVEIHKCKICGNEEQFPRYVDPKILLTTRKGRCGEWANAFTLICRSFGYDTRIVYDKTDHVWSEVWSIAASRWIHVDPCENAIDRPLLYEKGWNKKLTYIIAYSRDEIQDVTWRYTRNETAVMARRNDCTEESLLALISRLNQQRQSSQGYSDARKRYVVRRRLMELAELLPAPPGMTKPSDSDDNSAYGGRISGDAIWRLARGEITKSHVWKIPAGVRNFQLRYYIIKDFYDIRDDNNKILEVRNNWEDGVDSCNGGVFRNVENDWKMMYLARSQGNQTGNVTWSIEITENHVTVELFEFCAIMATFNDASVKWIVQSVNSDGSTITLPIIDCKSFKTTLLKEARKISVTASLSGGSGDIAWQQAQLFRQKFIDTAECSMLISIVTRKI